MVFFLNKKEEIMLGQRGEGVELGGGEGTNMIKMYYTKFNNLERDKVESDRAEHLNPPLASSHSQAQ